jgi:hypothetical protein
VVVNGVHRSLSSLPKHRTAPESHGISIEADQAGNLKACLDAEQQQGTIAPPIHVRPVGCLKEDPDLRSGQKMSPFFVVTLGSDGRNLLNMDGVRRLLEPDEVEEGSKRREAEIAGSDAWWIAAVRCDRGSW